MEVFESGVSFQYWIWCVLFVYSFFFFFIENLPKPLYSHLVYLFVLEFMQDVQCVVLFTQQLLCSAVEYYLEVTIPAV